MLLKYAWTTWGAVVVGVVFVALGGFALARPEPRCDGELMQRGDACIERGRFGRERVETYDDKARVNGVVQWAAPVAGALLLGVGGLRVARGRRARQPEQAGSHRV